MKTIQAGRSHSYLNQSRGFAAVVFNCFAPLSRKMGPENSNISDAVGNLFSAIRSPLLDASVPETGALRDRKLLPVHLASRTFPCYEALSRQKSVGGGRRLLVEPHCLPTKKKKPGTRSERNQTQRRGRVRDEKPHTAPAAVHGAGGFVDNKYDRRRWSE